MATIIVVAQRVINVSTSAGWLTVNEIVAKPGGSLPFSGVMWYRTHFCGVGGERPFAATNGGINKRGGAGSWLGAKMSLTRRMIKLMLS